MFELRMDPGGWWLCLCTLGIFAAPFRVMGQCPNGTTINVILLEDESSPWSLNFVKGLVLKAIATESAIHPGNGNKYNHKISVSYTKKKDITMCCVV